MCSPFMLCFEGSLVFALTSRRKLIFSLVIGTPLLKRGCLEYTKGSDLPSKLFSSIKYYVWRELFIKFQPETTRCGIAQSSWRVLNLKRIYKSKIYDVWKKQIKAAINLSFKKSVNCVPLTFSTSPFLNFFKRWVDSKSIKALSSSSSYQTAWILLWLSFSTLSGSIFDLK